MIMCVQCRHAIDYKEDIHMIMLATPSLCSINVIISVAISIGQLVLVFTLASVSVLARCYKLKANSFQPYT